jgi:GDP-D-mannose dehydratase
LVGDSRKAAAKLGWEPTTSFSELAKMMVEADLAAQQPLAPSGTPVG